MAETQEPVSDPVHCKAWPRILRSEPRLIVQPPVVVFEPDLKLPIAQSHLYIGRCVLAQESLQAARVRVKVLFVPLEDGADLYLGMLGVECVQSAVGKPLAHVIVKLL